jgi:hypothetical protein
MPSTLETLLDQTRDAVLAGDLTALSDLAPLVEAEVADLPRLDAADAGRLQRKADRNARLLQAATAGIRAARDRVEEIFNGPTLTTYDARGRRAAIAPPSRLLPKRI